MSQLILLDTGILGLMTHPRWNQEAKQCKDWMGRLNLSGDVLAIPEICDYELRRELIRVNRNRSLQRLDRFIDRTTYIPLTTRMIRLAAEYWAQARSGGYPTSGNDALDADVILAAQATESSESGFDTVIATTKVAHLSHFVDARRWQDIPPSAPNA
jgi:predicted nucleic acid-binding protein